MRKKLTDLEIAIKLEEIQREEPKQQNEFAIGFASWCIKKRVDFFDSTEIGETYTIDGNVSKYKMKELLEMYRNTTQSVV